MAGADDEPTVADEPSSTTRLEAFSDGVFAIAITLLVLEIAVPAGSEDDLWQAVLDQWPSYLAYAGGRLVRKDQSAGAFDIELDGECSFATAEDGVLRCLPRGAEERSLFADPECSRPVVSGRYSCDPPRFATVQGAVAPVVAQLAPTDPVYSSSTDLGCRDYTVNAHEYYDPLYTAGDALPPGMFVEVRLVTGAPLGEEPGP